MTSKHPCELPLAPCPYRSRLRSLSPPHFDPVCVWVVLRGAKGVPEDVVAGEVVGLLMEIQGPFPEWAVRAFRINRVMAHQWKSKKSALQVAVGKKQMAC